MAAPPRQQQGPGGNMSLPPGGNGAAGSGGPPAAEGAGPAAGPELSRPQQYTIPGILHYIQHEWARFEMERAHWEVERAELQVPGRDRCVGRRRRRGSRCGWEWGIPRREPARPGEARRDLPVRLGGAPVLAAVLPGVLPRPRRSWFPQPSLAARCELPRGSHFGSDYGVCGGSWRRPAGRRGRGLSASRGESAAWAAEHGTCSRVWPLQMESPRRGPGTGILPPSPGSPPFPIWPVWPPPLKLVPACPLTTGLLPRAALKPVAGLCSVHFLPQLEVPSHPGCWLHALRFIPLRFCLSLGTGSSSLSQAGVSWRDCGFGSRPTALSKWQYFLRVEGLAFSL